MAKKIKKVPYSDYEKGQLELVNKMILNVYKASDGEVRIGYSRNNLNGEYMIMISKGEWDIIKYFLRFDEFLHYVCDFCDIYFFLDRK